VREMGSESRIWHYLTRDRLLHTWVRTQRHPYTFSVRHGDALGPPRPGPSRPCSRPYGAAGRRDTSPPERTSNRPAFMMHPSILDLEDVSYGLCSVTLGSTRASIQEAHGGAPGFEGGGGKWRSAVFSDWGGPGALLSVRSGDMGDGGGQGGVPEA